MKKLSLILLTSLFLFGSVSYANEKSIEDIRVQVDEIQSKLRTLQRTNTDLKERLSNYESEIEWWRTVLKNLEDEIELLNQQ